MWVPCALAAVAVCLGGSPQAPGQHDRAFWRQIVQADGALPAGVSADALSEELSAMLSERDPELRDDIAYTLLATWLAVKPRISDAQARRLVDGWVRNLRGTVDASADQRVLVRSFSALSLAAAVARDNDTPYLDQERFRQILTGGLDYLENEADTRGFDQALGWVHATAHTSDLLKFLARNRMLQPADQQAILGGIARKAGATTVAWVSGEDERLGRVVLALILRQDTQWSAYEGFVAAVTGLAQFPERPTPEALARYVNARHLLTAMCALLDTAAATPAVTRARQPIVKALSGR